MSIIGVVGGTVGDGRIERPILDMIQQHAEKFNKANHEKRVQSTYEAATRSHEFAAEAVKVRFSEEAMRKGSAEALTPKPPGSANGEKSE